MTELIHKVGANIRKSRQQLGWSLRKLACLADMSPSYLSELERGIRGAPTAPVLKRLADSLNVSTDYLLGRVQDPTPPSQFIASRIRARRTTLNMSLDELARESGYAIGTIQTWESGRATPLPENIAHLANVLETTFPYLIGQTNDPYRDIHGDQIKGRPTATRIKELAASRDLTLDDVLTSAGISSDVFQNLDRCHPDPHILWPIAKVLNTSIAYLAGETDDPAPIIDVMKVADTDQYSYSVSQSMNPTDAQDLERAYLQIKKRREQEGDPR